VLVAATQNPVKLDVTALAAYQNQRLMFMIAIRLSKPFTSSSAVVMGATAVLIIR